MTVVNYINASLEIWGSVMSGVVALCMVLSKRPLQRSDRVYLVCLTCNAGVLLFDVLALLFRGNSGTFCWWGVRISNYLAFSLGAGLLISFLFLQAEQGCLFAQRESQLAQGRIAILLSLIQPHFLYNTLTAICGLCDEDPKEAKRVTAKFTDYLRHSHHFYKGTRGLL